MPRVINGSTNLTKLLFQYSATISTSERVKPKVDLFLPIKQQGVKKFENDHNDDDNKEANGFNSHLRLRSQLVRHSFKRKTVRFADFENLELTKIREFSKDEIPQVPKSAFMYLNCERHVIMGTDKSQIKSDDVTNQCNNRYSTSKSNIQQNQQQQESVQHNNKTVIPFFNQPFARRDFFDALKCQNVLLENAYFDKSFGIRGTLRTINLDFTKTITIKFTTNDWITQNEVQAVYISSDGFSDKFEFILPFHLYQINTGSKIIFAIQFCCKNQEFWDNNYGQNYTFSVIPQSWNTCDQKISC